VETYFKQEPRWHVCIRMDEDIRVCVHDFAMPRTNRARIDCAAAPRSDLGRRIEAGGQTAHG